MRVLLEKYWDALWSSYWLIPMVLALLAFGGSYFLVWLDSTISPDWIERFPWLYQADVAGAREMLSTIAGSMITVAGVTFSITIAAVGYAASQFGPRLLLNFMRDRGNQATLGVFIATFLYCLMVLRTVRVDEANITRVAESAEVFIPHLAILGAIVFAVASIGFLIYFTHHIPESILAANVIAGIGHELNETIEKRFPGLLGQGGSSDEEYDPQEDIPDDFYDRTRRIHSTSRGYIQYIDSNRLLRVAEKHDLLLRLHYRPGDFLNEGKVLVAAYPEEHVDDAVATSLRKCFVWGRRKTLTQDIIFLANELIEMSMRALSPGINDPYTAINCIDWLGSALINLARKGVPSAFRYDTDGNLRVIARPITFGSFADTVFDELRAAVTSSENATLHMFRVMVDVAAELESEQNRAVLLRHAQSYRSVALSRLDDERVQHQLEGRYRVLVRLINNPEDQREIVDDIEWTQGSS
ncbi:MAG: DUF2254 domain-containing protein [Bacteroidota bacterium]